MGDGASPIDAIRRQFVNRSFANGASLPSFDPLDPESVSARQRSARAMREGLNSAFGTSTRGTDLPQGGGLKGPQDDPLISGPPVTTQQGTNAVDDAATVDRNVDTNAVDRGYQPDSNSNTQRPRRNDQPRVYRF